MAYQNNGYARKKILTVTKGNTVSTYNITAEFRPPASRPFEQLDDNAFARLSDADYEARLAAFISYVYSLHSGLQSDCPDMTPGSVVYDVASCPITQN